MTRYDEFPFPGLPSVHELTDASNECRHECLPFDRNRPPECRCWNFTWTEGRVHKLEGKPRPYYPPWVKRRAVQLYAEGVPARKVAARFGANQRTVLVWVRKAGVEVRGRGRPWEKAA